ncbi:MAG: glycosyltransferase [Nitrososphaerota archaeon]
MRVHIISTASIPTPPPRGGYGGIERLVYHLVRGLENRNVRVTLYALDESYRPNGGLVTGNDEYELANLVSRDEGDVVIDWSHQKFYSLLNGGERVFNQVFYTDRAGAGTNVYPSVAVLRAYDDVKGHVIPPGIDPEEIGLRKEKEDFFLYFGRIIPEKGVEAVIAAARRANVHLKIAGHVGRFSYDQEYIARIRRLCESSPNVEFLGEVERDEALDLLGRAKAVVHFPRWLESFWIVGVEALLSGTPIVTTTNSGGPAEMVARTGCGVTVSTLDEAARVLKAIEGVVYPPLEFDPEWCRKKAVRYYSYRSMANSWLDLIRNPLFFNWKWRVANDPEVLGL